MKQFIFSLMILSVSTLSFSQDSGGTLDGAFSTPAGGMTDEQAKASQNFVHQGLKDSAIKQGCESAENKAAKNCTDNVDDVGSVLGPGLGQALESQIGKIYGMLFGGLSLMSGKGPSVNVVGSKEDLNKVKTATAGKSKKEINSAKKNASEEKSDYCIYAAMGYELIGGFWQQSLQDKIVKNTSSVNDMQLKSLVALKQTHQARQKTATFQATLYGATSGCYIARAAASQGRVVMDAKYWAKMAGAGALAFLFGKKAKKHKLAAEAVQRVIDKLPKEGKCNPWTDTPCFCGEATSQTMYPAEYQEICILNAGDASTPKVTMGCGVLVEGKMSYDKECKCKTNNSCFKAKIGTTTKFNFGSNLMADPNQAFDLLGSGNFDQGKFDQSALQSGVYAAKLKGKISTTTPVTTPKLTKSQKDFANSLAGIMSPAAAAMAAQASPYTPPGSASGNEDFGTKMAAVPKELKSQIEAIADPKYSSGSGFQDNGMGEESFSLPTATPEGGTKEATEVLTFAEQAVHNAEVTKMPEKPIFEIISDRYKRSAIHLNQ